MPRPPGATANSRPARVAGGNPRAVAGGAGPELPLFAPAMTTTATPKTIMARIGTPTFVAQPRKCRPARTSRDQVRLGGWGSSERSSFAHSALAARRSAGAALTSSSWRAGMTAASGGAGLRGPALYGPALYGPALYGPALYGPALRGPALYARSPNSKPGVMGRSSSGHAGDGTGTGWLTMGVDLKPLGAAPAPSARAPARRPRPHTHAR